MNTSPDSNERVIVYAGPSVSRHDVLLRVPGCILQPPARQGDVLSDLHRYEPTHVLLIDGEFQQHFSTWIKELVYALQYPTVRGVYGASSMGALRAAELADLGMIGVGQIFQWYDKRVTEDDSEVAVAYRLDAQGNYESTVPLVNLRASDCTEEEFEAARRIHWSERWPSVLAKACPYLLGLVDQKRLDACELLETFRDLRPRGDTRPTPDALGGLFLSQLERDRRIDIREVSVPLQRIDALVALGSPDRHQIFWDASNRMLCLHLAETLNVVPTAEDVQKEGVRHCQRHRLDQPGTLDAWLKKNGLNGTDFYRLMFQNARIAALHRQLVGNQLMCRKTQGVLDYLRTHGDFEGWARKAAEGQVSEDAGAPTNLENGVSVEGRWRDHCKTLGVAADGTFDDFLREFGFYCGSEFLLELQRTTLDGSAL